MMEKLNQNAGLEEITAITNVRIFDGYQIIAPRHIVIKGVPLFQWAETSQAMQQLSMEKMRH